MFLLQLGMDGSLSLSSQTAPRIGERRCSEDKQQLNPQTYPGLRRATVAYNQPLTASGIRSDVNGRAEMRPRSVDVFNDEEKLEKKVRLNTEKCLDVFGVINWVVVYPCATVFQLL